MSPDILRPQLQLALGQFALLGEELPALRGRRVYAAQAPAGARRLLVTLHPLPPEGPRPEVLAAKISKLTELGHSAVAAPVAMGTLDGRAWSIDGEDGLRTLADQLGDRVTLPIREAVKVMRDIARALTAMHRRGLAHGALSAETVLLAPEGTLLTGLALHEGSDPAADLEAFAALSRSLFYGDDSSSSSLRRRLPPEIAALLESMGSDDPSKRPQRAETVLKVLDSFPVEQTSALGSLVDSAGRGARSRGRRAALGLLALVGVGLLGVLWFISRH